MAQQIPGNVSGRSSNNSVPDHAMAAAPAEMPIAGAYEDQKNNGNRNTDENIGGAEKGGPGLSRAQTRMPPDADQQDNHDSPVEGSREDVSSDDVPQIKEDRSK